MIPAYPSRYSGLSGPHVVILLCNIRRCMPHITSKNYWLWSDWPVPSSYWHLHEWGNKSETTPRAKRTTLTRSTIESLSQRLALILKTTPLLHFFRATRSHSNSPPNIVFIMSTMLLGVHGGRAQGKILPWLPQTTTFSPSPFIKMLRNAPQHGQ